MQNIKQLIMVVLICAVGAVWSLPAYADDFTKEDSGPISPLSVDAAEVTSYVAVGIHPTTVEMSQASIIPRRPVAT